MWLEVASAALKVYTMFLRCNTNNLFADQSEVIHAEYIRLRRFLRPEGRRIISAMTFPEMFDAAAVIEGFVQFATEDTNAEPSNTMRKKKRKIIFEPKEICAERSYCNRGRSHRASSKPPTKTQTRLHHETMS